MEKRRRKQDYHKLITIVPNDYFIFHSKNIPHKERRKDMRDARGLVIRPIFFRKGVFNIVLSEEYYGGSANVAFVREDGFEKGIVAHELSHTLGQLKEHYRSKSDCQRFNGSPDEPCLKMKAEVFDSKGGSKSFPFPVVPFIVNIPLPPDYKKKNLYVEVLSPKGVIVYSAPVPKPKRKKERKEQREEVRF